MAFAARVEPRATGGALMPRMPILTSGLLALQRGVIDEPWTNDGSDWAELLEVDCDFPDASLAGEYWPVGVEGFLGDGDTRRLSQFDGETVAGWPLMTDPDLVEQFDRDHGSVDVAEYYRS